MLSLLESMGSLTGCRKKALPTIVGSAFLRHYDSKASSCPF